MLTKLKTIFAAGMLLAPVCAATAADYKVHRFTVTPERWNTNSFWLESDEGIVLIDAQLLIEDAQQWATLIKATGKPVKGAIITHAHPDHYGGLNTLRTELGYFPVITSKGTAETFDPMHQQALAYTGNVFGDRFDKIQIKPDQIIDGEGEITLAGITLHIEDIGPGESMNATLVYEPEKNILFSGDATMHHGHLYTGEGHSVGFLRQLNHIKTKYKDVTFIYAGHGDPARVSHVDAQIAYIKETQEVAQRIIDEGNYRNEDSSRLNMTVIQKHAQAFVNKHQGLGDYGFPPVQFVTGNIAGVITELERKAQASASNMNNE